MATMSFFCNHAVSENYITQLEFDEMVAVYVTQ